MQIIPMAMKKATSQRRTNTTLIEHWPTRPLYFMSCNVNPIVFHDVITKSGPLCLPRSSMKRGSFQPNDILWCTQWNPRFINCKLELSVPYSWYFLLWKHQEKWRRLRGESINIAKQSIAYMYFLKRVFLLCRHMRSIYMCFPCV